MLAYRTLEEGRSANKLLTGLIYIDTAQPSFNELLNMVDTPLVHIPESKLRPTRESLAKVMAEL